MFRPVLPRKEHIFNIDGINYATYGSRSLPQNPPDDNSESARDDAAVVPDALSRHDQRIPAGATLDEIIRSSIAKRAPSVRQWPQQPSTTRATFRRASSIAKPIETRQGEVKQRLFFGCVPDASRDKDIWNTGAASRRRLRHWKSVWNSSRPGELKSSKSKEKPKSFASLAMPLELKSKGGVTYPPPQFKLKATAFGPTRPTNQRAFSRQQFRHMKPTPSCELDGVHQSRQAVAKQQVLRRAEARSVRMPKLRLPAFRQRPARQRWESEVDHE
jgi:hypothetical protein